MTTEDSYVRALYPMGTVVQGFVNEYMKKEYVRAVHAGESSQYGVV